MGCLEAKWFTRQDAVVLDLLINFGVFDIFFSAKISPAYDSVMWQTGVY